MIAGAQVHRLIRRGGDLSDVNGPAGAEARRRQAGPNRAAAEGQRAAVKPSEAVGGLLLSPEFQRT
ncbi:hypothetical protein [Methylobacterium sp. J-070]|uniref:hypothetical protein n=1 Tax=Methylobacterium sp. J-070 TaxID=2836650 RepID=UPI001FB9E779|nr:hypothetical protein [Methylobacterium sp. J-070]MCJ2053862.1 hypothetical protein [Methylobacterium sp. J-070]